MDNEVPDDTARAAALLADATGTLRGEMSYDRPRGDADPLDEDLDAAIHALSGTVQRRAADTGAGGHCGALDADTAREQALVLELGSVRSVLRGRAVERQVPVREVTSLLRALRSFSSLEDLLAGAPSAIHRVGFERVMLSRVQGSQWLPRSGSVTGDPGLATTLVQVGTDYPGTLNGSMVEADVVRKLKPILVDDARDNSRVHRRLRDVIDCRAYVSAPLVVHGAVVGLIHADRYPGSQTVDSFDQDLLGAVAEGLGFAVERVVFLERLQALRRRLDEHTRTVSDLIDEFVSGEVELSGAPGPAAARQLPHSRGPVWDDRDDEPASGLTRRELDVLRRMALGETNVQIAHRLFLSEGTVKSHVKHILRKLSAANRAEAVSRYHLTMRGQGYSSRGR
jgi:DNA-binding CsgD family transcriptional regulator